MRLTRWLVGAAAALSLALTLVPLGQAQAMTPASAGTALAVKNTAAEGTTQVRFGGHFGGGFTSAAATSMAAASITFTAAGSIVRTSSSGRASIIARTSTPVTIHIRTTRRCTAARWCGRSTARNGFAPITGTTSATGGTTIDTITSTVTGTIAGCS